jgi:hypothetical protein
MGVLAFAASTTLGCTGSTPEADGSDLAAFVVPEVPGDTVTRTFVDFGGKVHLVGVELTPAGSVTPGGNLKIRLYWRRVGDLAEDWSLFTHIDDDFGRQLRNYDRVGPFRAALGGKPLGLARLELGKIYVDEQSVELPKNNELTPKIELVVGVWHDKVRLNVVSGTSNGKDAAVIAAIPTGVERVKPSRGATVAR